MADFQAALELIRDLDALGFAVALLWALWKGWLRLGGECGRRETALLEEIDRLREDAREDATRLKEEQDKHERVFEEFRRRAWGP